MSKIPPEFSQRRQQLMQSIGNNAIAIITSAPECTRSADTDYPYRQNSDFYYLTGFSEPEAIAVLLPGRAEGEYVLFNRPRDPTKEIWNGRRAGQNGAITHYGANQAYSIEEFVSKLPDLLLGREKICYAIGRNPELDQKINNTINSLHNRVRLGIVAPHEYANIDQWLHEMRTIKSIEEIALMRKAAQISAKAHVRAMQVCKPGMYEYELEAEFLHEFFRNGSRSVAYNSIIGSGENACILHYNENNAELKSSDLILIDAGCEFNYYASDITRTFPVNGRFTPEQKAIYEIVLDAQLECIKTARPGKSLDDIHSISVRVITEGLIKIGILKGSVEDLIEQKAYLPFYMHRVGHWIGLDTHDAGNYLIGGEWRKLEPNMVHTVEPGIYVSANMPNVDEKWWNIGVRIEDDVVITPTGCEVLSADAPKTVADIESLMAK